MVKLSKEDFLYRRKSGLGGSDMGAVMGVSKYRTPLDVYNDKISDEIDMTPNDILDLASFLEDYTARKYAELKGYRVWRHNKELMHPQYGFLKGNIDRKITLDIHNRTAGILECKALSTYNFRKVEMYGLPDEYIIQMQFYFAICRNAFQWGAFAILNRDNGKMLTFEFKPDNELMQAIIEAGVDFWQNHIEKRIPPECEVAKNVEISNNNTGKIQNMNDDNVLTDLIRQYREYAVLKSEADALVSDVKERIAGHLQGFTAVECAKTRIYQSTCTKHTIDTQKLKKEQLAIYYKYLKESKSNSLKIYDLSK